MTELYVFEIDDGENWWYVAESKEEALEMHLEPLIGAKSLSDVTPEDEQNLNCPVSEMEVKQYKEDTMLKICDEDRVNYEEKTALEWTVGGKGFLATTCL